MRFKPASAAILAVLATLSVCGSARADLGDCSGAAKIACWAVVPFAATSWLIVVPVMTSSGVQFDKEAYIQQVKDDAAEYVVNGGEESLLLLDAINQVRAQSPQAAKLTDSDIARLLLSSR